MIAFMIRRFLEAVPVLVLATVLIFAGLRLLPGDPATVMTGLDTTPETLRAIRSAYGLDQPLPVQYIIWMKNVISGDLGVSYWSRSSVAGLVASRLPATLELSIAAMLITVLLGLSTGILAAVKSRRPLDWIVSGLNGVAVAVPGFWLGILAILLFSVALGWLPPGGRGDLLHDPILELKFLLLPALALALPFVASLSRLTRASMLEVLGDDYVRTARAKGIAEPGIVLRHALRNALVPVITILGLQFGRLLGGAVIIESVFSWPGIGQLIRDSIANRDYLVVQACLLLLVVVFVVVNLLVDVGYGIVDPRIRLAPGRQR